jgi:hypothetical protein
VLLKKRFHILFDGDSGGAGSSAGDPPSPVETNGDGADKGEVKSYTQAELDRMFGERTRQARKAGIAELLKELGVEKAEDIKAALQKAKEAEEAQLSELEKANKRAADLEAKAKQADEARTIAETRAQEKLLKAAVMAEATRQGFNDAADAWQFVDRTKIEAGEDDSFKGLDKAVKAVLEAKPYLAKAEERPRIGTPKGGQGIGGRTNPVDSTLNKRYALPQRGQENK